MAKRARRIDKWWQARYASSQRRIEHELAQSSGSDEPLGPYVPALSSVLGSDGTRYRLRLIPPGEPLDNVGAFALVNSILLSGPGGRALRADNGSWIAVVERQRGPWRGFERLEAQPFDLYSDAAVFLQRRRQELEHATAL